jgi:hypothetical protein
MRVLLTLTTAALVAVVLLAAGCGGTPSGTSTTPNQVYSNGDSAKTIYAQCKTWAEGGENPGRYWRPDRYLDRGQPVADRRGARSGHRRVR